ncbi:hypothetical protein BD414DRAFT_492884 [Trametes punicea]|nr:hypothetical protein BD414DRAFT_492884 [Trametes punicea]
MMSSYPTQSVQYAAHSTPECLSQEYGAGLATGPSFVIHAPRPQIQMPIDYASACQASGEYLFRDFLTPSPSSSCPSDHASSSLPSSQERSARKRSSASSRREERRRGPPEPPSAVDEGLVVRGSIAHPYARLYNRKQAAGKRRKMWNHALEKMLFTPQEISTMGAPHRRTIYTASLEAHVDRLHEQLLGLSLFPVPFEKLEPYRGLNSKTAKSMVSGLHHDAAELKLKILELERANRDLEERLNLSSTSYKSCL